MHFHMKPASEELIQLHLADGTGGWSSPLVEALPLSRVGDMKQEVGGSDHFLAALSLVRCV